MSRQDSANFRTLEDTVAATSSEVLGPSPNRGYLAVFNLGDNDSQLMIGIGNPTTGVIDSEFPLGGGRVWSPSVTPTNPIHLRSGDGADCDYIIHEG